MTLASNRATWPPTAAEVTYFVDPAGTWFAAEVVRGPRWSPTLAEPLDLEAADIRIAFLDRAGVPASATVPPWLLTLPAAAEFAPAVVVDAALRAWTRAPNHRAPGATPEAYLAAGFRALCPPHPACEVGPGARETLETFLRERAHPLGRLGAEGRDAFSRLVRLYWPSPAAFADDILRERIRDEGAARTLDVLRFLEDAAVAPEAEEFATLAFRREALLRRLTPERFFEAPRDFDEAALLADAWAAEYARAYRGHYRDVVEAAGAVLAESAPALAALAELRHRNAAGPAVGGDAPRRLEEAVGALMVLPPQPPAGAARVEGVTLGRMPDPLAEARLAGAAVVAALEVQRRRSSAAAPEAAR